MLWRQAQMTICYTISDAHTIEYYKLPSKNTENGCGFYRVNMAGI